MKNFAAFRVFLFFFFFFPFSFVSAQPLQIAGGRDDTQVARQYVNWIQQAINEGRLIEARTALLRASDFANVSSDISYLLAVIRRYFMSEGETRLTVLQALNKAIETNRWEIYNENQALLIKAEILTAKREYYEAMIILDQIGEQIPVNAQLRTDAAMLRLLVLRGMAANGNAYALAQFRSQVQLAMNRFPRDPRPLYIFFEYARNINQFSFQNELTEIDLNLMDMAIRRIPFLLEADPELAWMAVPFISDIEEARRLLANYRAGGIPHIQNRDFRPHPASIALALDLGLIDDRQAADELFSGSRGWNYPFLTEKSFIQIVPEVLSGRAIPRTDSENINSLLIGNPILDYEIIIDVYNLLRSEEGRSYFTGKLLTFTGVIISDNDHDGFLDSYSFYDSGIIRYFSVDVNQDNTFCLSIFFGTDGVPVSAIIPAIGREDRINIQWERYPFVQKAALANEVFLFRPADFQFAPITFIDLGGSRNFNGLLYPVLSRRSLNITHRTFILSCFSFSRPGVEFDGAIEVFYMERGIPLQAVQTLNGQQVSITEFERGLPVIQYLDMDLDGRMETIRRFHRPMLLPQDWQFFDYRLLKASSESDWFGDGRYITREVYRQDGSVVYSWDMDGSGEQNYTEIER
jgi:tetratricopeptide (TPR) repeat protein